MDPPDDGIRGMNGIGKRPSEDVEQFLFHEARLLDDGLFLEWVELFEEDGLYWVPSTWTQEDGLTEVSIIHEPRPILHVRARRLLDEATVAQWPESRTLHQLTNLTQEPDVSDGIRVHCDLMFTEYRRMEQRLFGARLLYVLRQAADGFKISRKVVRLLNCDQENGHLRFSVPF
jgi:benzoate/toluate 1,2-dioxygenase subunit beta